MAFGTSECMQVCRRLVVELQCPGQRIEYLWGGVAIPALLKGNVVVGAHARQQRELRHGADREHACDVVGDPGASGRDQLAAGAQILASALPDGTGPRYRRGLRVGWPCHYQA